jgi:hypothetical protein
MKAGSATGQRLRHGLFLSFCRWNFRFPLNPHYLNSGSVIVSKPFEVGGSPWGDRWGISVKTSRLQKLPRIIIGLEVNADFRHGDIKGIP